MTYIEISKNDIKDNDFSFSASLYEGVEKNYQFYRKLSEFVISLQKGNEPGSLYYCNNKKFQFIRTSNISDDSDILDEDDCIGIAGSIFKNHDLKKNQILIVKDATLGKTCFLTEDYPSYMICAGINSLTCVHPYYVFAILKHPLFRQNFDKNVPKGSTLSHAKDVYLDFDIPLPNNNDKEVMILIENLMYTIISNETYIKEKFDKLNNLISNELNFDEFNFESQNFPNFHEIFSIKRLDAGIYSKKTKFIENLIKSYHNGYFFIDEDKFKSGSTPSHASPIKENDSLDYMWITTTNINKKGIFNKVFSRSFEGKNNINEDVCLINNRTSKKIDGESGKYVGVSVFYDYSIFGEGHHNQGIFRISGFEKSDLIFISTILNHPLYREYFGEISIGSKMKEIKINNLSKIPFPNFSKDIKIKIKNMYYSENKFNPINCNNSTYLKYYDNWKTIAGIYDLFLANIKLNNVLTDIIYDIYNGKEVCISYDDLSY